MRWGVSLCLFVLNFGLYAICKILECPVGTGKTHTEMDSCFSSRHEVFVRYRWLVDTEFSSFSFEILNRSRFMRFLKVYSNKRMSCCLVQHFSVVSRYHSHTILHPISFLYLKPPVGIVPKVGRFKIESLRFKIYLLKKFTLPKTNLNISGVK